MKTQEFINLFIDELEIENKEITPSTELSSLEEWTSMGMMIAIGLAADNFNVVLKGNDLKKMRTVKDFMEEVGLEKFEDE